MWVSLPYATALASCFSLVRSSDGFGARTSAFIDPSRLTRTSPHIKQMQARINQVSEVVSAYLAEMNMPKSLFDAMVRVPPDQIKVLTDEELDTFGLNRDDPVFEELEINGEARRYGVSKPDYLANKPALEQCQHNARHQYNRGAISWPEYVDARHKCEQPLSRLSNKSPKDKCYDDLHIEYDKGLMTATEYNAARNKCRKLGSR